jgi:hypothetical protein
MDDNFAWPVFFCHLFRGARGDTLIPGLVAHDPFAPYYLPSGIRLKSVNDVVLGGSCWAIFVGCHTILHSISFSLDDAGPRLQQPYVNRRPAYFKLEGREVHPAPHAASS